MEMGMLALALGLAADAKDQDVTARAQALAATDTKLREVTGKDGPAALAVIEGWKEGAAKLTEANAELAKVQAREEASAFTALVTKGEESGQITPGKKADVLKRFPTSAALAAYLEVAPAALPSAGKGDTAAHAGGSAGAGDTGAQGSGEPKALTYKGKTYGDLSYSERAAWINDKDLGAQGRAAKAEYDRAKGGV